MTFDLEVDARASPSRTGNGKYKSNGKINQNCSYFDMKEWLSNSVSWLSSGNNQQNQPQSPYQGQNQQQQFPQPQSPSSPFQHQPPYQNQQQFSQPQSPQHSQFSPPKYQGLQMQNQRPPQFQHNSTSEMDRRNTMIQELKDNYDGWYGLFILLIFYIFA